MGGLPTIASLKCSIDYLLNNPEYLINFLGNYYLWLCSSADLGIRKETPNTWEELSCLHKAASDQGKKLIVRPPADAYLTGEFANEECLDLIRQIYLIGDDFEESRKVFFPSIIFFEDGFDSSLEIVGDTHGDFYASAMAILHGLITGVKNYIILGDYIDRGSASLENFLFYLLLHRACPQRIILLRGNHESRSVSNANTSFHSRDTLLTFFRKEKSEHRKFCNLCDQLSNLFPFVAIHNKVMLFILKIFNAMPVMAINKDRDRMFVHAAPPIEGCLSFPVKTCCNKRRIMATINRPIDLFNPVQLVQYLWGDVAEKDEQINQFNDKRGAGWYFNSKQSVAYCKCNCQVYRGHQLVNCADFARRGRIITVFSTGGCSSNAAKSYSEQCCSPYFALLHDGVLNLQDIMAGEVIILYGLLRLIDLYHGHVFLSKRSADTLFFVTNIHDFREKMEKYFANFNKKFKSEIFSWTNNLSVDDDFQISLKGLSAAITDQLTVRSLVFDKLSLAKVDDLLCNVDDFFDDDEEEVYASDYSDDEMGLDMIVGLSFVF